MKKFKDLGFWGKVCYIFIGLILLGIYCNIGYWFGSQYNDARCLVEKTGFHKFLLGPGQLFIADEASEGLALIICSIFWPLGFLIQIITWGFYFLFLGGLVRLIM